MPIVGAALVLSPERDRAALGRDEEELGAGREVAAGDELGREERGCERARRVHQHLLLHDRAGRERGWSSFSVEAEASASAPRRRYSPPS